MKTLPYLLVILVCSGCLKKPVRKSSLRLPPCTEFDQQTGDCLQREGDSKPKDNGNDELGVRPTLPVTIPAPIILDDTTSTVTVKPSCASGCLYAEQGKNYKLKCKIKGKECEITLETGQALDDLSQCAYELKENELAQAEMTCKIFLKTVDDTQSINLEGTYSLTLNNDIIDDGHVCVATYQDQGDKKAAVEITAGNCDIQTERQFKLPLDFERVVQ